MTGRPRVLSMGRARAEWPRDLARWATAGHLSIDHQPCLGPDALESHLAEGVGIDLVLIDGRLPATGRDLLRRAGATGAVVIVVDDEAGDWDALGADAVIAPPRDPETLSRTLEHLRPVDAKAITAAPQSTRPRQGRLIAVTGPGGSGRSTIAHALACRWGSLDDPDRVVLADLSLTADQHVHHGHGEPGPGLIDLAAALDRSDSSERAVDDCTTPFATHRLLTGLARARDWTAISPSAAESTMDGLRSRHSVTIADVDGELDGRRETGSIDLEERNALSRIALHAADHVIVVSRGDLLGLHRLCRIVSHLQSHDIDLPRVSVVVNGAGRTPPLGVETDRDVRKLLGESSTPSRILRVPHQRNLERHRREQAPIPTRLLKQLAGLDELIDRTPAPVDADPVPA